MNKKSTIYTKTGDKGETALIGGKRVPKFHPRIEAYGSVDELMAHTTMLRDLLDEWDRAQDSPVPEAAAISDDLLRILDIQMSTASHLAADCKDCPVSLPEIKEAEVEYLEVKIDEMDASLPPLTSFLIPGGHPVVAQAHIVRTVCRRVERSILKISEEFEIEDIILRYFNRMSDYFFVLSRKISAILGIIQKPWKPGL